MDSTNNIYIIKNDFQVPGTDSRILELDRDYKFYTLANDIVEIDGKQYSYILNSIRNWIVIKSNKSLKGKKAIFREKASI